MRLHENTVEAPEELQEVGEGVCYARVPFEVEGESYDPGYYFLDEMEMLHGPFGDEIEAREALERYMVEFDALIESVK